MPELSENEIRHLEEIAKRVRCHVVRTISEAGVGHPGGSLSEADILAALYFHVMRVDPQHPNWEGRDRFVLSKGHGAAGLYATLAERGYFSPELLKTFGRIDSCLQVHPDMHLVPGIEISTGALGQGLSVALGIALAARLDGKAFHVYCLIGDGESQEGQIWEAAEAAAHYKVDNLTVILDYNRVQLMGPLSEIMEIAPLADKWRSFNWAVMEIDGHDIQQIIEALEAAKEVKDKPCILIAHTVKGKGVSYMEGQAAWHGKPPNEEQLAQALAELGCGEWGGTNG
ncbi:MAG: transketolase [Anaerolineales bacterium]|nr:MAG: transketolase [Anaerolineales bacterium]